MEFKTRSHCPDCGESFDRIHEKNCPPHEMNRRDFLKKIGRTAVVLSASPIINKISPVFPYNPNEQAETVIKELHKSLSPEQKKVLVLPWHDSRRLKVVNNWHVVPQRIKEVYSKGQQGMIREILKSVTSEDGYDKITKAMKDDAGSIGNYSACLFSDGGGELTFLLTGRHQTIRANGSAGGNAVLDGPLFYGHAVEFYERPDHPGNVWWHQARLAGKVYHALDGKQQEKALVLKGSPADSPSSIKLRGENGKFTGISVSELSRDQKELVLDVLKSLLEPYRVSDVEEVLAIVKSNGGLEKLHLTFYKDGDLPDKENIWDRWRLEGPALNWYFRGSPHVHSYINIAP